MPIYKLKKGIVIMPTYACQFDLRVQSCPRLSFR